VAHCLVSSRLFSGAIAEEQQKDCAICIPTLMPLFSGAVAGEQRKAFTTASFCEQMLFYDAATLFLAPCNFLSLGRLDHYESSRSFRFAKAFLFFLFLSLILFVFAYTRKILEIVLDGFH
jgi:hypothetical protein